jgi:hypothetical protein
MPPFQQNSRSHAKKTAMIGGGKGGTCSAMVGKSWMIKTKRSASQSVLPQPSKLAEVLPQSQHAQINLLLAIVTQSFSAQRRIEALQSLAVTFANTTSSNSAAAGPPCDDPRDVTAQLCAHCSRAATAEERELSFKALASWNIYRCTAQETLDPDHVALETDACKECILREDDPAVQVAALHTLALVTFFHADVCDTRLLMGFVTALLPGSCPSDYEAELDTASLPWESPDMNVIDAAMSSLAVMMVGLPMCHQVEFAIPAVRAVCHQHHAGSVARECRKSSTAFLGLLSEAFAEMEGGDFGAVRTIVVKYHQVDPAMTLMRLKNFTFRIETWQRHVIVDALKASLGGGLPLHLCQSVELQSVLDLPDLSYDVSGHLTMLERLGRDNERLQNKRGWQAKRDEGRRGKAFALLASTVDAD